MKRKISIVLALILSLLLICSCSNETQKNSLTYKDIYNANSYSAITAKHGTILLKDYEWVDGEYILCEYYWSKSGYALNTAPYIDDNGNSIRDVYYLTDEGSYMYVRPMIEDKAAYDIFDYYSQSGYSTVEKIAAFGLISPDYNQKITEYKKTDNGCEVKGENSDNSLVASYYENYFSEGEHKDGDKLTFTFVLNENNEMISYENYYVFADGSEAVKVAYGEFVYDDNDCPDYIKSINTIIENGAKDIAVKVHVENEIIERKVYSDIFVLYTDCEVYLDAGYKELLSNEDGYYVFETSSDIIVYLKAPSSEE